MGKMICLLCKLKSRANSQARHDVFHQLGGVVARKLLFQAR